MATVHPSLNVRNGWKAAIRALSYPKIRRRGAGDGSVRLCHGARVDRSRHRHQRSCGQLSQAVPISPNPIVGCANAVGGGKYTFVVLFSMWFDLWAVHGRPEILNYPFLLSIIVELVLLFQMAAAVLPDEPLPNDDLAAVLRRQCALDLDLFSALSNQLRWSLVLFQTGSPKNTVPSYLGATSSGTNGARGRGCAFILMPRNRRLHLILISALLVYWLVTYSDNRIGG